MDELFFKCSSPTILNKISGYFENLNFSSSIPGLYWLPVPDEFLTSDQRKHAQDCGPYVMAVEINEAGLVLEFLVRAQNNMHCECITMAGKALAEHMSHYVSSIIETQS